MIVINLLAGPSTGKSTLAAKLFYKLKVDGYNVEYITEYAKDLVYEDNYNMLNSGQINIFGKQLWRTKRLVGKVDIVVADSPLLLNLIYYKENNPFFKDFILHEFHQFDNMTYFLERDSDIPYQQHGRYQNSEQAKEVDAMILNLLNDCSVDYNKIPVKGAAKHIISDLKAKLK